MPTAAEADILAVLWRLVPATLLVTLQSEFAERAPGTRLAFHSAYSTTQIELLLKGQSRRESSNCQPMERAWKPTAFGTMS